MGVALDPSSLATKWLGINQAVKEVKLLANDCKSRSLWCFVCEVKRSPSTFGGGFLFRSSSPGPTSTTKNLKLLSSSSSALSFSTTENTTHHINRKLPSEVHFLCLEFKKATFLVPFTDHLLSFFEASDEASGRPRALAGSFQAQLLGRPSCAKTPCWGGYRGSTPF